MMLKSNCGAQGRNVSTLKPHDSMLNLRMRRMLHPQRRDVNLFSEIWDNFRSVIGTLLAQPCFFKRVFADLFRISEKLQVSVRYRDS
jgi:hypothetical protein